MEGVADCLQHRSDLVLETLAALELKVEKTTTTTDAQDTDPEFDTEIRVLNDFPEDWMAGWIQHQTGMAINDRVLEEILVADPAVLDKLRRFSLQLHPQLVMPKSLQIQKVCGRVLDQVSRDIGSPLASTWAKSHIDAAGNISWKTGCPSWGRICGLRVPWYLHCSCIVLAQVLHYVCMWSCGGFRYRSSVPRMCVLGDMCGCAQSACFKAMCCLSLHAFHAALPEVAGSFRSATRVAAPPR